LSGRWRRGVGALLAAVGLLIVLAPAAWAHAHLESSDPADGTTLATAPAVVRLTFSEAINPSFVTVTLTGPDGQPRPLAAPSAEQRTVTQPIPALDVPGRYVVGYRVVSADGHPVAGVLGFTMAPQTTSSAVSTTTPTTTATTTPAPVSPTPATAAGAQQSNSGGGLLTGWIWAVIGLVALAAAVLLIRMLRRSRRT
jgi:copper resistance protein C